MDFIDLNWEEFKKNINTQIHENKKYIYRGQPNSEKLKTTLHRTGQFKTPDDIELYFEKIIPYAYNSIVCYDNIKRDLKNEYELAEFVAYLRHNGFPTPLIDFTYSPYIAAFFAFNEINHFSPQCDHVIIYCFDREAWLTKYKQNYNYSDKNLHVSVLEPASLNNPKQLIQQSLYLYTNLEDIEAHIEIQNSDETAPFLKKYRLAIKERPKIINELALMNITPIQLFPSIESVCKKISTDISLLLPMGKTATQIASDTLQDLLKLSKRTTPPGFVPTE